jgi:hypothetical protein
LPGPRAPISLLAPPAAGLALPPPGLASEPAGRARATLGGQIGAAGRSEGDDTGGSFFRAFGRYLDSGQRIWEVGFGRRPIYPMNPHFQYGALYGLLAGTSGWSLEVGGLGASREFHVSLERASEIVSLRASVEHIADDALCGGSDGEVTFGVGAGRLRVPLSSRVAIAGLASYRGRIARNDACQFPPALLTVGLGGDVQIVPSLWVAAGYGRYSLYYDDDGKTTPVGWGERDTNSSYLHFGGRWTRGQIALLADYRHMSYGDGTNEITVGIEVRTSADAP